MTGTYYFVSFMVKIMLPGFLLLSLSPLATTSTDKTQCFVHLSFNSPFLLIISIWDNHQKLLRYFNGTVIVPCFRIPLA